MARGGRWRSSTLMTNGINITSTGNNPNTLYFTDFRSGFDVFAAHTSTGTLTSPSGQYPVTNQSVSLYRPANAHTDPNFGLILEAQKDPITGQWYSALVDARYTLQYSPPVLVEVRCKMTNAQGMWPSTWMKPTPLTTTSETGFYGPWPSSGEVDIFEVGEKTHKAAFNSTIHGDNPLGSGFANHWQLPDPNTTSIWKAADVTQYHVYGLEWRTTGFKWFLDGVQWQATSAGPNAPAPFDRPFYPIFNIAVGGTYPGAPDVTTPTSGNLMVIDWFRVTQLSPNPVTGTIRPWVSTSAWNAPITTSTATYAALPQTAASLVNPALGHVDMSLEQDQVQLYYASNTDPTVTVTVTVNNPGGPSGTYSVKIPANTIPGAPDSLMSVDGVDGKCYDFTSVVQTTATTWTAASMYAYPLTTDTGFGAGTYPNGTRHGARGDGGQQNGGNFTIDDWNRGSIDHGLSIKLANSGLKSGPVFPAVFQNGDGTTAYAGTIPVGTKLAIKPPSKGGPAKPTTLSAIGSMVWDALVTYGGHVVTRGGGFAFIATGGAKPVLANQIAALRSTSGVFPSSDGDIILANLSVCSNWDGTPPPPPPPPPPTGAIAVFTGGPWYTAVNWSTAVLHGHPRTLAQWVGNTGHIYVNATRPGDAISNTWHTYNTDPLWTITGMFNGDVNVGGTASIRIPAGVTEARNGGDYNLNVWNHDTGIHYDFYGFHITSSTSRTGTAQAIWQRSQTFDGWGTGVYPNGVHHGVRAAANQFAGGEISAADLRAGIINHGLGVACASSSFSTPVSLPAINHDSGWETSYTGNVPIGSLFAIPPVSLGGPAKPSGLSTIGSMVWDACATYGSYLIDSTGGWTWYAEDGNDSIHSTSISVEPLRASPYDGDKIVNAMQLITNAKPSIPNQA